MANRCTVHEKILVGDNLANLENCELFAKFFLINIHRYTINVFGILLTVVHPPNFPSPIVFTVWFAKISHTKYFPCTVVAAITPFYYLHVVNLFSSINYYLNFV